MARTAKEQFDRQAKQYDGDWNNWSKQTLGWLIEAADPQPTDRVIDIATGTGFTARAFAPLVASVVGTDVSSGMLAEASRFSAIEGLTNIEYIEAPAEDLPFEDGAFDVVSCRIAAHHFVNIAAFAEESFRVLKPGGKLLVVDTSVPDNDFLAAIWQNDVERVRDPSHGKNYTVKEWSRILRRAGFKIDFINDSGEGIKIPLTGWIVKAGCSEQQEAEVRRRFGSAPQNVRTQFKIEDAPDGDTYFTWHRVQIKAIKPV